MRRAPAALLSVKCKSWDRFASHFFNVKPKASDSVLVNKELFMSCSHTVRAWLSTLLSCTDSRTWSRPGPHFVAKDDLERLILLPPFLRTGLWVCASTPGPFLTGDGTQGLLYAG